MLNFVLSYKKYITGALIVTSLIGGGYVYLSSVKSTSFDEGYTQAQNEYQIELNKHLEAQRKTYEDRLRKLKKDLHTQHSQDLLRFQRENKIDKQVETVVKIIKEKEYVEAECNNVHPDVIGLFNKTYSDINTPTRD